jgi:hypothetical protein
MVSRDWDWSGTVLSPILPQGALGLLSYPTTQPYLHQWWQSEHGGRGRESERLGKVDDSPCRSTCQAPYALQCPPPRCEKEEAVGGGGIMLLHKVQ